MELIHAKRSGEEVAVLPWDVDFEVGTQENTFEMEIPVAEWDGSIEKGDLVYIPWTEFGGIVGTVTTSNNPPAVFVGGYTWRGLLDKKIITPGKNQDYYTTSGNASKCLTTLLNAFYQDGLMQADQNIGVNINPYQFNRYTTLLSGINAMLKTVGYRLKIRYDEAAGNVELSAGPIENYAAEVNYDNDELKISSSMIYNGVNHLICLGQGELASRTVVHIYTDENGNVVQKQQLFGRDEIAEVYDNSGAESAAELRKGGLERLNEVKSQSYIDASAEQLQKDMEIGDVITGTDPVTGASVRKPIGSKVLSISGGIPLVSYRLEDN